MDDNTEHIINILTVIITVSRLYIAFTNSSSQKKKSFCFTILHAGEICMLSCRLLIIFKNQVFDKLFHEYHMNVNSSYPDQARHVAGLI